MRQAICADVAVSPGFDPEDDPFFPEKGHFSRTQDAQKICLNCPVRTECKDYRNRIDPKYGVWAGEIKRRGES